MTMVLLGFLAFTSHFTAFTGSFRLVLAIKKPIDVNAVGNGAGSRLNCASGGYIGLALGIPDELAHTRIHSFFKSCSVA